MEMQKPLLFSVGFYFDGKSKAYLTEPFNQITASAVVPKIIDQYQETTVDPQ